MVPEVRNMNMKLDRKVEMEVSAVVEVAAEVEEVEEAAEVEVAAVLGRTDRTGHNLVIAVIHLHTHIVLLMVHQCTLILMEVISQNEIRHLNYRQQFFIATYIFNHQTTFNYLFCSLLI